MLSKGRRAFVFDPRKEGRRPVWPIIGKISQIHIAFA
jgi:hypothetical protein